MQNFKKLVTSKQKRDPRKIANAHFTILNVTWLKTCWNKIQNVPLFQFMHHQVSFFVQLSLNLSGLLLIWFAPFCVQRSLLSIVFLSRLSHLHSNVWMWCFDTRLVADAWLSLRLLIYLWVAVLDIVYVIVTRKIDSQFQATWWMLLFPGEFSKRVPIFRQFWDSFSDQLKNTKLELAEKKRKQSFLPDILIQKLKKNEDL